jgi:hypothetical protein
MQESPAMVPLHFFMGLRQQQYERVWQRLSLYSRRVLLDTLYQSLKPGTCTPEQLAQDFETGQGRADLYWQDFARHLQLEVWLTQTYKPYGRSQQQVLVHVTPANLMLIVVAEEHQWRFGYFETFLDQA